MNHTPLNILIIVPSYKPAFNYGGPIRSIANLCEELVSAHYKVTVFTTNANGLTTLDVKLNQPYTINGVTVFYHKRLTKDHSNFSPGLLKHFLTEAKKYDIIHIQSWWNLVSMPSVLLSLMLGKKPLISLRGTMTQFSVTHKNETLKKWFHRLIGKKLLQKSTLHSTSWLEDHKLGRFVSNRERYIIPNILEFPDEIYPHSDQPGVFRLIFLGRIHPAKNIELLLEIFNKDFQVPYHLLIIGEGPEDYVSQFKVQTKNNPNIEWRGNIDGNEKYKLLAQADLLLLPSHIENYGNVVIESLSQGTPVLISENVGCRDFVERNKLGWIAAPDKISWRNALLEIWSDVDSRNWIRRHAPAIVRSQHSTQAIIDQYLAMYHNRISPLTPLYTSRTIA